MALRKGSIETKNRILSACVRLFLRQGYHNTPISQIISEADVSVSTFQNIFRTKDGVLGELIEFMFGSQFGTARGIAGESFPPVYVYAVETALQLVLTELNENLRDIYLEVYTVPETAEYIHVHTAMELYRIFEAYFPGYTESDFYEIEIGTAGIMRGYMAKKCDIHFPLNKKVGRFLSLSLRALRVPEEELADVLSYINKIDLCALANGVVSILLAAITRLCALPFTVPAYAAVTEDYKLQPGGTYYFDLSSFDFGKESDEVPDATLHYVPFKYVGAIQAYKLSSPLKTD